MTLETLIQHYGYLAVVIGTFLEGEMVVVAAGFAAHRGYLDLVLVWICAFMGSFAGDQFYFALGRYKGRSILLRHPTWRQRIERAHAYLERHQIWLLLSFRFLYGLRTVVPFAVGTSAIPGRRFIWLNAVGGTIWAITIGTAGYYSGAAAEALFGQIGNVEGRILVAIFAVGLLSLGLRVLWRRRRTRRS